jgi:hypothetical protein
MFVGAEKISFCFRLHCIFAAVYRDNLGRLLAEMFMKSFYFAACKFGDGLCLVETIQSTRNRQSSPGWSIFLEMLQTNYLRKKTGVGIATEIPTY